MVFSERDCEFLPEDVRLSVAKPVESQMADARLAAYKLLSSASHALYLTYPVVDVTHQKCYPSAVIAQIQRTSGGGNPASELCIAGTFVLQRDDACGVLSVCAELCGT